MLTVQVDSQVSLDINALLEGIANLEIQELNELTDRIIALRASKLAPSLPEAEGKLLEKINNGIPFTDRERYEQLTSKLNNETLTHAEHGEYMSIVDQIQKTDAERMKSIIELAKLRNSTVDDVMDHFGLKQTNYV